MTQEAVQVWANLDPKWQIARLTDWAAMLEERLAQLDPYYKAYPWGRTLPAATEGKPNEQK